MDRSEPQPPAHSDTTGAPLPTGRRQGRGAPGGASDESAPNDILLPNLPAPIQRPPRSLGSFVAGFKSACTKRINTLRDMPGTPVWLRNYYERVIRNERELKAIRKYILDNPANWEKDKDHPDFWL